MPGSLAESFELLRQEEKLIDVVKDPTGWTHIPYQKSGNFVIWKGSVSEPVNYQLTNTRRDFLDRLAVLWQVVTC